MSRTLVVCDHSVETGVFRDELTRRANAEETEVFLLLLRFRGRNGRFEPPRRFWRAAHARLDATLAELTELGMLTDGRVSEEDPSMAVRDVLHAFQPSRVIVACPRGSRRCRDLLERALRAHAREANLDPPISWL